MSGQFGHTADDVEYNTESNVYFLSTRIIPSEKAYLTLGLSYVDSSAGMSTINFMSISQEAADALAHENYDFTEVNEYSDLDYSRFEFNADLNIQLSERVGLIFGFLYNNFTDDDPYLVDETGTYMWAWTGVRFSF